MSGDEQTQSPNTPSEKKFLQLAERNWKSLGDQLLFQNPVKQVRLDSHRFFFGYLPALLEFHLM